MSSPSADLTFRILYVLFYASFSAFISSAPKNSDREMYRMKFCMKSTNGSFHNSGAMDTLSSLNALQPPPPSSSSSTTGDNLNRSVVSASTNRGRR